MRAMEANGFTRHFPLRNNIPREVFEYDYVIVGGWHESYENIIKRHKKTSILFCSSLGQVEQSGETKIMDTVVKLAEKQEIEMLLVGSKDLYLVLKTLLKNVTYFPYPVFDKEIKQWQYRKKYSNTIGFFVPFHPRKNILNQVYASMLVSRFSEVKDVALMTNLPGLKTTKNLKIENTGWMNRKAYLNTIRRVKVGLHVTHTESFGQQPLEYMLSGTPVILSACVGFNLEIPEDIADLIVWNPDSVIEISQKINDVLSLDEDSYKLLSQKVHVHARSLASKRNELYRKFMKAFLEK